MKRLAGVEQTRWHARGNIWDIALDSFREERITWQRALDASEELEGQPKACRYCGRPLTGQPSAADESVGEKLPPDVLARRIQVSHKEPEPLSRFGSSRSRNARHLNEKYLD